MRLTSLFAVLFFATTASAAQESFVNEQYDLKKISDTLYSFIAPESDSGVVQTNCTVIIGDDSVLVVDTGQFPTLAERMIADIKKITPKPVRYVVNTHWHLDHVWGNAAFRAAFPGVALISTEYTRELVESESPKYIANQPATNTKQAADLRKLVADGKLPDGRVLPDETKKSLSHSAETLERINKEIALTINTPPTIGFEKELTINLGKREVKVMWLGRANTGGDAIVWVPDAKLLMAGDTVVYPSPFAFGSYMSEWPVTLQKMLDLNPAIIIPGHGPLMHDTSYVKTLIEVFQTLFAQVKTAAAEGLSLDDTRKKVTLDEYKDRFAHFATTELMRKSGFSSFLGPAIDRAYQEATGKLKPETED